MARKTVAVIQPDGSRSHHIKFKDAFSKVEEGRGHWDGIAQGFESQYKAIRLFDERVVAKGVPNVEWHATFSGDRGSGLTRKDRKTGDVHQVLLRDFRARLGCLVMQAS